MIIFLYSHEIQLEKQLLWRILTAKANSLNKADAHSKISGLKTGADAYLFKPFDKMELLVRLEMLVKNQHQLIVNFKKKFQSGVVDFADNEYVSPLFR